MVCALYVTLMCVMVYDCLCVSMVLHLVEIPNPKLLGKPPVFRPGVLPRSFGPTFFSSILGSGRGFCCISLPRGPSLALPSLVPLSVQFLLPEFPVPKLCFLQSQCPDVSTPIVLATSPSLTLVAWGLLCRCLSKRPS